MIWLWLQFLGTPAKIITTIECFEDLQCPNTIEVVLMRAWTSGAVDAVDHDARELVRTPKSHRTHGMGSPKLL